MKIQLIGQKLTSGQGIGEVAVFGQAIVASSAEEAISLMKDDSVLVVKTTDKAYMPAIAKASALIVEEGGLTSHAAVVAIAEGIPVVVGVTNATQDIKTGMIVTVDPRQGSIYEGETTV